MYVFYLIFLNQNVLLYPDKSLAVQNSQIYYINNGVIIDVKKKNITFESNCSHNPILSVINSFPLLWVFVHLFQYYHSDSFFTAAFTWRKACGIETAESSSTFS